MSYCIITHAGGIASHKSGGQEPPQHLGVSYAAITQALEFSDEEGGEKKTKDKN